MSKVVTTKYGKIKGESREKSFVWRGLPYALPPIGERRFKEALPPLKWKGVYDATFFRPACLQMVRFEKQQESEDCLYLNVYSPSTMGKKPVMIFIHGGAFIAGSGSQYLYDAKNVCEKGVVVVSINYRLGAFSMFNFSFIDKEYASNLALKDQLMAIKWVYENIEAFGGDPENITVCGQSAGAISVICLLNAPQASKYIKKAIAISPLPDIVNSEKRSIDIAKGFLEYLEIDEQEFHKMVEMDCETLNEMAREYTKSFERKNGLDLLMPVVDGEFLPYRPLRGAKEKKAHYPPLVIGLTKNEVDIVFKLKSYKDMAVHELEYLMDEESQIRDELIKAYGEDELEKKYPLIGRDWLVGMPSEWYSEFHSKWGDVWVYLFDYENLFLKLTGLQSAHTLDLIFAFGNFDNLIGRLLFSLTPFRKKAYELGDRLREDLVEFIKTAKAPWQRYGEDYAVKIYNKDGDKVKKNINDPIRKVWKKTKIYKNI